MKAKLVHPVQVNICPIDRSKTKYDADFQEPIGGVVYGSPVTITAQVRFDRLGTWEMVPGGGNPKSSGYLLVDGDPDVNIGDKITGIGGRPTELYITEKRPTICYGGKAQMTKVFFESRDKG